MSIARDVVSWPRPDVVKTIAYEVAEFSCTGCGSVTVRLAAVGRTDIDELASGEPVTRLLAKV